jgi:hypothetical protein
MSDYPFDRRGYALTVIFEPPEWLDDTIEDVWLDPTEEDTSEYECVTDDMIEEMFSDE